MGVENEDGDWVVWNEEVVVVPKDWGVENEAGVDEVENPAVLAMV